MLGSFCLELMMTCRRCGGRVPVGGITTSLPCHRCGNTLTLNQGFWTKLFGSNELNEAARSEKPKSVHQIGSLTLDYGYGFRFPRCGHCSGTLPLDALGQGAAAGRVHCPGCGKPAQVRPADDLCREIHAGARFVVGETHRFDRDEKLEQSTAPVVFACMSCGAGLPVDGSSRTVSCAHCGSSNYLPDGLWLELNPVPTLSWIYLVCELTRHQTECFVRRQSTKKATILAIARGPEVEARVAVAAHRGSDPDVARLLAGDPASEVRRALAKNPKAPADVVAQLASDPDASVRAAVAARQRAAVAARQRATEVTELSSSDLEEVRASTRGARWIGAFYVLMLAGIVAGIVVAVFLAMRVRLPASAGQALAERSKGHALSARQATRIDRNWAAVPPVVGVDDPAGGDLIIVRQLRSGGSGTDPGLEIVAYVPEPNGLRHVWTRPIGGDSKQALERVHLARAGRLVLATDSKGWASLLDPKTGEYRGDHYRLPGPARAACTAGKKHAWVASGRTGILMKGTATGREVAVARRPAHCRDPDGGRGVCPAGLPDEVHCTSSKSVHRAARGTRYLVSSGGLRVAVGKSKVVGIDRRGRRRWGTRFDTEIALALPAGDRVVVLLWVRGDKRYNIACGLDARSGAQRWMHVLPGNTGEPQLALSSSHAYVLRANRLHAITLASGERVSYSRDVTRH